MTPNQAGTVLGEPGSNHGPRSLLSHHPLPVPGVGSQIGQAKEAVDPGRKVAESCEPVLSALSPLAEAA